MAKRVVVFSDDDDVRSRLEARLKEEGYEAFSHPFNQNLLIFAREHEPAAIVLDSTLEWGQLAPLITELKQEFLLRNTAIIAATNVDEGAERFSRLAVHNLYLIARPIDSGQVIWQLRRALGHAA